MDCQSAFHILLLLVGWSAGKDRKYCSLCKTPGSHTVCRFPEDGPGPQCLDYKYVPLTDEEELLVVEQHNQLRNKVALGMVEGGKPGPQPPATNMRELSWDNELAYIAQRWADQCIKFRYPYQHDECRTTEKYFAVGQNIAASGSTGSYSENTQLKPWIMMWFNEVQDFSKDWVKSFYGDALSSLMKIGHYTQLVWANTHSVGCGRVVFTEYLEGQHWTFGRLVCNYAPSGNMQREPVYLIGRPCSACPNGTTCSTLNKGLCSSYSKTAVTGGVNTTTTNSKTAVAGGANTIENDHILHYAILLALITLRLLRREK